MKIIICGSIAFTYEMKKIANLLSQQGHESEIPFYSQKILNNEITLEKFLQIKEKNGDADFRKNSAEDLIKRYYRFIKDSDAVLVVNIDKKEIKYYIGGNTLLEMGFAHVLDKKIFLYNPIPEMHYSDEIKAMQPIILNQDLSKII